MKHANNKRIRSAKDVQSQNVNLNSYSNRDIVSRTPKSKKILDLVSKILFPVEVLIVIAVIIYATLIQIFPIGYIFIFVVLLGVLAGVHIKLLSGKKRGIKTKRITSIAISVCMILVSAFGMSYMGIVNGVIGDISIGAEDNKDQVDNIAKTPFLVYISGTDTRNSDKIAEKSLSDVNMVVAVNPKQKKVLMVSTPRDYYVALYGDPNKMDKLTHAGRFGVECSMETLEHLYDIDFNYYAKVNFKSVYDIVNAVGGVTVNSEFDFSSRYSYTSKTYHFKKGLNELTGDSALAFVRERKSFANGDRQRGIHQQVVIKAVIEKAISPSMLIPANIESMLKAISKNTRTNFSEKEIKKLINYQMSSIGKEWKFESMSVDGRGKKNYTNAYPNQLLYTMEPNMDTVNAAKEAIRAVMKGEESPKDTESNVSSSK